MTLCTYAVLLLPAVTADFGQARAGQEGNSCELLLGPLETLHQDLTRIEEKLDALANPKWEYKVLTPNVIDENAIDRYSPNLNPMGAEGWELITYSPDIGYIMKRRATRPETDR